MDDFNDIFSDFENRDWNNFDVSFSNVFPNIDEALLTSSEGWFGNFWGGIIGFNIMTPFVYGNAIFQNILIWITLLMIIYLIYLMKRIMARDWDRLSIEMSRIYHIIKMLIDTVIFIFHWIFEIIHAILDVTIPFT